ncbi:CDP-glycerol glycerophosphotransferase family protein [Microbulbifer pacificus]|uniref:CDP-glycerol glycerophosphotransferase family protein n=1 Tax=Microbulbifer pacificus TaxID=407164 RepID=UPI00131A04BB|nr:CDP-glycerol glycerophosphotransferase family protein [Microbulbifer pacificus]
MTGIDKVAVELSNELIARGHEIVYITIPGSFKSNYLELDRKVRIHYIHQNYRNDNVERLRSIVRAEQPDVVVPMFSNSIVSIFLAALRGLDVPLILSEHSDPNHYVGRWWLWGRGKEEKQRARMLCFHGADRIHLLNKEFSDDLPDFLREKVSVIPNPVPIQVPSVSDFSSREKLVVSIGRLDESGKRLSLLINAFSILKEKLNGWRLHIYGDGPSRQYYEDIISREGLHGIVELKGFTESPELAIGRAKIFCIPSIFEGCPLTLVEAKALGVPAIGFDDCTGVRGMISHGEDGLLVKRRTAKDLSNALETLIRDESYLSHLSELALQDAKKYSRECVFDQWESLISETVSQAKMAGPKLQRCPSFNLEQQLDFELDELTSSFSFWKRFPSKSYWGDWQRAQKYIDRVERSYSWRLTKILRWANYLVKTLSDVSALIAKLKARKVNFRNFILRKVGEFFSSGQVVFIDVPGFQDMKSTFGGYFDAECFFEDVPYPFLRDLKIARARVVVSGCGAAKRDVNKKGRRIELWHASGAIKSVANTSYNSVSGDFVIVSPSDDMREKYARYFNVNVNKVRALGVPKTDKLLCAVDSKKLIDDFFKENALLHGKKIYLFAPTFRGQWPNNVWYSSKLDFSKIASMLEDDEVVLVKLHPAIDRYAGWHDVEFVENKVINAHSFSIDQLLAVSEAVVSDYSSIVFDAVLSNKKMVLYAEDIDLYNIDRGITYDYRALAPCPLMEEPDELKLLEYLRAESFDQHSYDLYKSIFLNKCDGMATSRILELIGELSGKKYDKSKGINSSSGVQYGESLG